MIDLRKIIQETPRAKYDEAEEIVSRAESELAKMIKAKPDSEQWITYHVNKSMSKKAMDDLFRHIKTNFVNKTQMTIEWIDEYVGVMSYDYEPPKIKFSITR